MQTTARSSSSSTSTSKRRISPDEHHLVDSHVSTADDSGASSSSCHEQPTIRVQTQQHDFNHHPQRLQQLEEDVKNCNNSKAAAETPAAANTITSASMVAAGETKATSANDSACGIGNHGGHSDRSDWIDNSRATYYPVRLRRCAGVVVMCRTNVLVECPRILSDLDDDL